MQEKRRRRPRRRARPASLEPLPRVAKPATVRRLVQVDAAALAALVGRLSDEAWRREDGLKENRFPCFHHTRHVVSGSSPATATRAASSRTRAGGYGAGGCCR